MRRKSEAEILDNALVLMMPGSMPKDLSQWIPPGRRHYYRCLDCLDVFVLDHEQLRAGAVPSCGICGGGIEAMGHTQAKGDALVAEESVCPCNEMCVSARGPLCSCACGGRNHGLGLIRAIVATGENAREVVSHDAAEVERLRDRANQFRAFRTEIQMAISRAFGRVEALKRAGRYLAGGDWEKYLEARGYREELHKRAALKVPEYRAKRLRELEDEICKLPEDSAPAPKADEPKAPPPPAEPQGAYIGKVGERLSLELEFVRAYTWDGAFGTTALCSWRDPAGNIVVWKTAIQSVPLFETPEGRQHWLTDGLGQDLTGALMRVTGTVKEHSEYKGQRQTVLSRCKVEMLKWPSA